MPNETQHTLLLVEDDRDIAKSLTELFQMVGWNTIVAPTLEDFRARLREGGYCLGIHDLEIPALLASLKAHVDAGILSIQEHRGFYPRCNETGMHYMALLCMSAFARDHRNGRRARRAGVDDCIVKPLDDNDEPLIETVRRLLVESGREDHAQCARITALARREATTPPPPSPASGDVAASPDGKNHFTITGKRVGRGRTELIVNGRTVTMTNSVFIVLLGLIEARRRGLAVVPKEELGVRGPSDVMTELALCLVPGTKVYAPVRKVGYTLHDDVVIDAIDADALAQHDEIRVRRLAASLAASPRASDESAPRGKPRRGKSSTRAAP